jgi:chromate transporter
MKSTNDSTTPLLSLAWLFLRLGATAFGGPPVHIAIMEDEVVRRLGWLSREQFLDLVGAANLIPGPNSTELAIHIGRHVGGRAGLVVAGVCFILPAFLIVTTLAWLYVEWGALPQLNGVLYGVKPVVVAIVVQAIVRLARTAVRSTFLAGVGLAVAGLNLAGVHELIVLLAAGIVVAGARWRQNRRTTNDTLTAATFLSFPALTLLPVTLTSTATVPISLSGLFWFFLKIGSVLFGSGYVLLAFLRADLVERWHWLSESQLLDAIAVGQITPGPIFTTATFIGYILAGVPGAVVATVGIFLPAFFFVAVSAPFIARLRSSPIAAGLLDGVNVGSLALMAIVTFRLGQAAFVDSLTIALAILSTAILLRTSLNSTWLILIGATIGLIV